MNVRGRMVRAVDLESLAPHRCGFESRQEVWILSCDEAIQLAYGTSVVLLHVGHDFDRLICMDINGVCLFDRYHTIINGCIQVFNYSINIIENILYVSIVIVSGSSSAICTRRFCNIQRWIIMMFDHVTFIYGCIPSTEMAAPEDKNYFVVCVFRQDVLLLTKVKCPVMYLNPFFLIFQTNIVLYTLNKLKSATSLIFTSPSTGFIFNTEEYW